MSATKELNGEWKKEVISLRNEALYKADSIPNALELYIQSLIKTGEEHAAHALVLKRYHDEILNHKYLSKLRTNFNDIYNLINNTYPNLRFLIEGRRKSFISTDDKIIKLIEDKKSLDLLRDTHGFRIMLFGNDSKQLINDTYSIAEEIIKHFISKNSVLCEADPVSGTNFDPKNHPNVIRPKSSGISEIFRSGVKDYILYPKENGYQSIHLVFRSSTGKCFEVQIRTFDMHLYAETGKANHTQYKKTKYKYNTTNFERDKINIPGYGISSEDKIFDFIGLEESLEILRRQKTF